MREDIDADRRRFLGTALMTMAGARLGMMDLSRRSPNAPTPVARAALEPVKQIDAGVLNVGYVDAGPANGPPVILLHGWPYDIHAYADVVPIVAAKGYRVIVPHLRGYGTTRFLAADAVRNGEQAALAVDTIALMDALGIQRAIVGGFDWGSRTAAIMAVLWPERVKALVAVSGYLIVDREANLQPLPPRAELGWWYQYYFATERGVRGYRQNTRDFNKLIWQIASPKWTFSDATFERSAASFDNPDHVSIVIHNYRWRLSMADGEGRYAALENTLARRPAIAVPAITIGSDFDGLAADGKGYADKFLAGRYEHRVLDGVGHNVPQEDPRGFARAVIDADGL